MSTKKLATDNFSFRLRFVRKSKGMNQEAFSEKMGISQGYLSELENGKNEPSNLFLIACEYVHGISRAWLETGRGEMFVAGAPQARLEDVRLAVPEIAPARRFGTEARNDDYEYVPIVAPRAAAGLPEIVDREDVIDVAVIHRRYMRRGGLYVSFEVRGDSMSPRIPDGALVAVNLNRTNPEDLVGQIVLAHVEDGITVKYLSRDGDRWLLVPENRDSPARSFAPKELRIVGAVEWWFAAVKEEKEKKGKKK